MSEDFDKEAERERLREKYESDSEGREVTERMSQLLLQGATMTNKHCDTCGSPIFRYQGQAFCPTCQAEAQAGEAGPAAGSDGDTSAPGAGETVQTSPAGQSPQDTGEPSTTEVNPGHESVGAASTGTAEIGGSDRSHPTPAGGQGPSNGSGAAVNDSLAETIRTLSERARQSEDPRQAKTLLEAAREAAETLATLQGR